MIDTLALGARADGATDDTAALQRALDLYPSLNVAGGCVVPRGVYRITDTLVYQGYNPYGLRLLGDIASAGPDGAVIRWDGPPGGTMFRMLGAAHTTLEHIALDGAGKAGCCLSVEYDHTRDVGSFEVTLRNCVLGGVVGDASATVRLGMMPDGITADTYQVNHILLDRCAVIGYGTNGTSHYGVITGTGNVKNFAIRDCKVGGFRVGILHGGSGAMAITGLEAYYNTECDIQGYAQTTEIRSLNSEGSGRLFWGLTANNPASVSISDSTWASANVPPDDMVVLNGGFIDLAANHFYNNRTPSALPKVALLMNATTCGSIESRGNYYANAVGVLPVVDSSGNDITGSGHVRSFGDYGAAPPNLAYLTPVNG